MRGRPGDQPGHPRRNGSGLRRQLVDRIQVDRDKGVEPPKDPYVYANF